jgi:hypothetical protein
MCCFALQVLEIKRLNAMIASLRSELNKYEEQLEDCRKYQTFLNNVTPIEWFQQQVCMLMHCRDIGCDWCRSSCAQLITL